QRRQEVGQLVRGQRQPGRRVQALQAEQREAALACLAVQVVGQVQAGSPVEVEGLDVAALALGERRLPPPGPERRERRVGLVLRARERLVDRRLRIVEQQRQEPVRRRGRAASHFPPPSRFRR